MSSNVTLDVMARNGQPTPDAGAFVIGTTIPSNRLLPRQAAKGQHKHVAGGIATKPTCHQIRFSRDTKTLLQTMPGRARMFLSRTYAVMWVSAGKRFPNFDLLCGHRCTTSKCMHFPTEHSPQQSRAPEYAAETWGAVGA
jgi:hypothetical protein